MQGGCGQPTDTLPRTYAEPVPAADPLPRSVRLACWYAAWAAGACSLDDARDGVVGGDAAHDVLGLPGPAGGAPTDEAVPLVLALGRLRSSGGRTATPALPVPGDLVGLAGPPRFNADALEAGEAVLLPGCGLGLVPTVVGAGVTWQVSPAAEPTAGPDAAEAEQDLRETLLESSARLADLDVARWRPEAADGLRALRATSDQPLATGFGPRAQRLASLARRCLSIVDLAITDDGGSVSAYEVAARQDALARLERSARHALVAAASAPVQVGGGR